MTGGGMITSSLQPNPISSIWFRAAAAVTATPAPLIKQLEQNPSVPHSSSSPPPRIHARPDLHKSAHQIARRRAHHLPCRPARHSAHGHPETRQRGARAYRSRVCLRMGRAGHDFRDYGRECETIRRVLRVSHSLYVRWGSSGGQMVSLPDRLLADSAGGLV
ncbi:unnamed protein product [Mycena citricolor]|uniref:Uncharacterized protein n=1 Tax=Mycena citricolor TaxID=2018698 RepID=A0AAD2HUY0_9AGAR|nr:unnamed protein product [Mycena citricolor]